MRAVTLRFYNKRLSESRAIEQNQEKPMGAGWTAYYVVNIVARALKSLVPRIESAARPEGHWVPVPCRRHHSVNLNLNPPGTESIVSSPVRPRDGPARSELQVGTWPWLADSRVNLNLPPARLRGRAQSASYPAAPPQSPWPSGPMTQWLNSDWLSRWPLYTGTCGPTRTARVNRYWMGVCWDVCFKDTNLVHITWSLCGSVGDTDAYDPGDKCSNPNILEGVLIHFRTPFALKNLPPDTSRRTWFLVETWTTC